jgi:mono/diheme cytochrome c family protein
MLLWLALLAQEGPLQVAGDDLKPGLSAIYRSGDAWVYRIDPRPAFALGHSSPHPRIPPGRFEVTWTGAITLLDPDTISFDAFVGGEVTVSIDGTVVLKGKGESDTAQVRGEVPLERKPGTYRITIDYRSLRGVPARLQVWWQGKTFTREPLPAFRLKHLVKELPEAAREEVRIIRGREAVAQLGCARCHSSAFPGVDDPPPGPTLADVGSRVSRPWLLQWLEKPGGKMPALFTPDRKGFVERWIVADYVLGGGTPDRSPAPGNHRMGKQQFLSVGCVACHLVPDLEDQEPLGRRPFQNLGDRMGAKELTAFLLNPHGRYPDGRMPRQPLPMDTMRDIAAYLLLWSKPTELPALEPPTAKEIEEAGKRFGRGADAAGRGLLKEKRCVTCHVGLGESGTDDVPIAKPGDCKGARFEPNDDVKAYLAVARQEKFASPVAARARKLARLGCVRCHSRDGASTPPLEEASSTLGGAYLQYIPFLRTPRLSNAVTKYAPDYLRSTIRDGVSGMRHSRFTFKMPAFGADADELVQAIAEADGDVLPLPSAPPVELADPTAVNVGPSIVGFEGYSCVSCHLWNRQLMAEADPGAIGPELTAVTRRLRRDWFDRWMEDPARIHPGTPMPQIFKKGQPATVKHLLEGDAIRQRDALWAYLSKGPAAPSPKPLPPLPIAGPLVAQIPVRLPDNALVESITVLTASSDALVYDLGTMSLRDVMVGAKILRTVRGRLRTYALEGTSTGRKQPARAAKLEGYDLVPDGVRIRTDKGQETIRLVGRRLTVELDGKKTLEVDLPPAQAPPPLESVQLTDAGKPEGSLERPGYRAIAYPRPKTVSGEDLVMPGAIAADPRDGRVYVASMKLGELFVIHDPKDNGEGARFDDYAKGLFQEAYSMLADSDGLHVLHRRNLTRVLDTDGDGKADRFDRVAALPHGVAETYDYGYGLVREKSGSFLVAYAPYANRTLTGSGGVIRLAPGGPQEVAYGFRNPVGWCANAEGDVFYTDNQGEWVATNKLCHIVQGRYYGFPNPEQKEHVGKPRGRTTIWVPYAWARSINGATVDTTGGKFGPFAGQVFMAELMYGGAIVRANVERVNGEMQGACFPFWGKGLLGPLTMAFDPKGRMWVGSITEPGWMAQPDRGAVFRIDFTGEAPFEIQSIHALSDGFRLVFTAPVDPRTSAAFASYTVDHHRYEYTGAYGSPELDRTRVGISKVSVTGDLRSVELKLDAPLVPERVYMISARGVKSEKGDLLVHPVGAYTLNEIPR